MFHGIVSVLKCDSHLNFLAYSNRVEVVVNHFFFSEKPHGRKAKTEEKNEKKNGKKKNGNGNGNGYGYG